MRSQGSSSPLTGRSVWRIALWCACAVGLFGMVGLLYLASVHSLPPSSDGATVVLEGKAMSSGNFTLNHWALSLDSFWLVDVPVYAIAILIGGVHNQLLNLVPAIVATAVVATGAWIAWRGHSRWAGVFAAGTVVAILGLPTHAFSGYFLLGPLHVTTTLWCLAAFVALRRGRFGWGWAAAVVLLAAGLAGDFQTLVLGVVPIGLAGLVGARRAGRWMAAVPALAAALGGLVLAEVVRRIARLIGTFTIAPANPRAPFHQMTQNLYHVFTFGAALEDVKPGVFGPPAVPHVLQLAHAVGLAVGALAIVLGLVSVVSSVVTGAALLLPGEPRGRDSREALWFEDVLVFGLIGGCGTFVWLSFDSSIAFARYLNAPVIFGAILAGCLVGKIAELTRERWSKALLTGVAALVVAGCASTFVTSITMAPPVQPVSQLASYLEAHHLTKGIGDYWSASIVTVVSSDAVVVRPVSTLIGGQQIGRYLRQSSSSWYGGGFEFLVYNSAAPWDDVEAQSALASFGPPRHVAVVGKYRVLTWAHDLTIRTDGSFAPQPWAHPHRAG